MRPSFTFGQGVGRREGVRTKQPNGIALCGRHQKMKGAAPVPFKVRRGDPRAPPVRIGVPDAGGRCGKASGGRDGPSQRDGFGPVRQSGMASRPVRQLMKSLLSS